MDMPTFYFLTLPAPLAAFVLFFSQKCSLSTVLIIRDKNNTVDCRANKVCSLNILNIKYLIF